MTFGDGGGQEHLGQVQQFSEWSRSFRAGHCDAIERSHAFYKLPPAAYLSACSGGRLKCIALLGTIPHRVPKSASLTSTFFPPARSIILPGIRIRSRFSDAATQKVSRRCDCCRSKIAKVYVCKVAVAQQVVLGLPPPLFWRTSFMCEYPHVMPMCSPLATVVGERTQWQRREREPIPLGY